MAGEGIGEEYDERTGHPPRGVRDGRAYIERINGVVGRGRALTQEAYAAAQTEERLLPRGDARRPTVWAMFRRWQGQIDEEERRMIEAVREEWPDHGVWSRLPDDTAFRMVGEEIEFEEEQHRHAVRVAQAPDATYGYFLDGGDWRPLGLPHPLDDIAARGAALDDAQGIFVCGC